MNLLEATCACGSVSIELSRKPEYLNDCNCRLCRNSGGVWGYFDPDDVSVTGLTSKWSRRDRELPAVSVHFCDVCGATTHWTLTQRYIEAYNPEPRMGVNMRLFDMKQLEGVVLHYPDGLSWDGVSEYGFRRPSETIGEEPTRF